VDLNHTQFVGFVEGADDRRASSYTHALVDAAGPVADMFALRGRRVDLGEIATVINRSHAHSSPFYYDLFYAKQNARAAGILDGFTSPRTQQRQFRKFLIDVAEVVRALWPLINRLAQALLTHGSLTYGECKDVLFPRRSRATRILKTKPARREMVLQLAA
jgi:hypothetical protein